MSEPYIGEIKLFAGSFAPVGWALCHGQLESISSNEPLFSLIGTTYGGDGRTTFGLPDLRGRLAMHMGTGPGLSTRPLGQRWGSQTVNLASPELPAHNHPVTAGGQLTAAANTASGNEVYPDPSHIPAAPKSNQGLDASRYSTAATDLDLSGLLTLSGSPATTNAGSSQAHNNLQPTLVINYIISLFGVYPSRN